MYPISFCSPRSLESCCDLTTCIYTPCYRFFFLLQPEGLDSEADAEANRIVAEITGEALGSATVAPVSAVKGKAGPVQAEQEPVQVSTELVSFSFLVSIFISLCSIIGSLIHCFIVCFCFLFSASHCFWVCFWSIFSSITTTSN